MSEPLTEFVPQRIDEVTVPVDRGEVLRYLGYPAGRAPSERIHGLLDAWIPEAMRCAAPRADYLILPVREKDGRRLRLQAADELVEFRGAIGEFLGVAEWIVVFVATAGSQITARAAELVAAGEDVPGMIVNAVGSERAEAAETAVIEQVRARAAPHGFLPTLPYSPGYCGMALTEQRTLFSLFGGTAAGVSLSLHCLMQPIKSVSGLIGLGPAAAVQADGSPCDRCELRNCNMRR